MSEVVILGSFWDQDAKGPWDPPKGRPAGGECFAPCQILQPRASAHDFDENIDFFMAGDVIYEIFSRVLNFHKNRFSWTLRIIVRMHPGSSKISRNAS